MNKNYFTNFNLNLMEPKDIKTIKFSYVKYVKWN